MLFKSRIDCALSFYTHEQRRVIFSGNLRLGIKRPSKEQSSEGLYSLFSFGFRAEYSRDRDSNFDSAIGKWLNGKSRTLLKRLSQSGNPF